MSAYRNITAEQFGAKLTSIISSLNTSVTNLWDKTTEGQVQEIKDTLFIEVEEYAHIIALLTNHYDIDYDLAWEDLSIEIDRIEQSDTSIPPIPTFRIQFVIDEAKWIAFFRYEIIQAHQYIMLKLAEIEEGLWNARSSEDTAILYMIEHTYIKDNLILPMMKKWLRDHKNTDEIEFSEKFAASINKTSISDGSKIVNEALIYYREKILLVKSILEKIQKSNWAEKAKFELERVMPMLESSVSELPTELLAQLLVEIIPRSSNILWEKIVAQKRKHQKGAKLSVKEQIVESYARKREEKDTKELVEIEELSYSQKIQLQLSILQELIVDTPDTTEWIITLGDHAREVIETFSLGVMEPFINEKNMWILFVEHFTLKRVDIERMEQYYKSRLSWYLGSILKELQPKRKVDGTTVYQNAAEKALIDLLRSLIETKIVPRTRPVSESELTEVYALFEKEEEQNIHAPDVERVIEPITEPVTESVIDSISEPITEETIVQPGQEDVTELEVNDQDELIPLKEETTIETIEEETEEVKVYPEPDHVIPEKLESMEEKRLEETEDLVEETEKKEEKATESEPEVDEND